MKTLIRSIVVYTSILFVLTKLIPGFTVAGGLLTFVLGGVFLALLFLIVRPMLNLLSLPASIISMGLFIIFIDAFLLYVVTIFITDIQIVKFSYPRVTMSGFVIPSIGFNLFFAYIYTAFVLLLLDKFIDWVRK